MNNKKDDINCKTRRNINVSIQKKDFLKINKIINDWEYSGANISSEVCNSILLKNILEHNPTTQTLIDSINLIKNSLKNKDIKDYSEEDALSIALEKILSININAVELSNFIENKLYFTLAPNPDLKEKNTNNTKTNKGEYMQSNNTFSDSNILEPQTTSKNTDKAILDNRPTIDNPQNTKEEYDTITKKHQNERNENNYQGITNSNIENNFIDISSKNNKKQETKNQKTETNKDENNINNLNEKFSAFMFSSYDTKE